MKELNHPSIKHPERDISLPGFEPPTFYTASSRSTKELLLFGTTTKLRLIKNQILGYKYLF
jgi:hypothetical protein